jgi:hypothetical protein
MPGGGCWCKGDGSPTNSGHVLLANYLGLGDFVVASCLGRWRTRGPCSRGPVLLVREIVAGVIFLSFSRFATGPGCGCWAMVLFGSGHGLYQVGSISCWLWAGADSVSIAATAKRTRLKVKIPASFISPNTSSPPLRIAATASRVSGASVARMDSEGRCSLVSLLMGGFEKMRL